MAIFRDLPISRKFACSFGVVCLICALLGTSSLIGFIKMRDSVNDMVTNCIPSTEHWGIFDTRLQRFAVQTPRC